MTTRFFRSNDAVYESIRSQLDAAYGYPNAETKTLTSITPAADAPHDSHGRVYLAIASDYCDYNLPAELLPQLIANRAVEEITEAEYQAAVQTPDPLQG
jgi:hypothetical protein